MERLSFASNETYSGIEAAIHVARYALARYLCKGKKVLDIACGEGYGSKLLLDWGASEVVGIDTSDSAIASARNNFSQSGIRYLVGDAMKIDQIVPGEKFDVIISIETIEHLLRPNDFLSAIAVLRAENGCVLITCPNDWWYYPNENEGNIYHVRKYSYEEFIDLATTGLGIPDAVGIGVPSLGFINLPMDYVRTPNEKMSQIDMMECKDHSGTLVLPPEPGSVSFKNCSYFVAAWGVEPKNLMGAATLPISMDSFSAGFWQNKASFQNEIDKKELQLKLCSTQAKLDAAVKEIAKLSNLHISPANNKIEAQSDPIEEQQLLILKFRNQANVLFQETNLLQEALAERNRLIGEKDQLLGEKDQLLGEKDQLLGEKDQLLDEKDQLLGEQEIYLRALLRRWNFITAVPRKVLPTGLILGVKKFVRRFKSVS